MYKLPEGYSCDISDTGIYNLYEWSFSSFSWSLHLLLSLDIIRGSTAMTNHMTSNMTQRIQQPLQLQLGPKPIFTKRTLLVTTVRPSLPEGNHH